MMVDIGIIIKVYEKCTYPMSTNKRIITTTKGVHASLVKNFSFFFSFHFSKEC